MKTLYKKNTLILVLTALFCLSFTLDASAQQMTIPGTKAQISLKIAPAHPKPFDTVHLIAESFSTDLNRSTINWYVNGKLVKSGVGQKELDTTVGDFGTKQDVRMAAKTSLGMLQSTVTLQPAEVDLFWQAHSFTPPFYKGKAQPTHKSGVTVVASPHLVTAKGVAIDPHDLIYMWRENGTAKADKSGIGRNSYELREISIMRGNATVDVSVTAPAGTLEAVGTVVIYPETPKLLLYEHDPLEGIKYNKALTETFELVNDEVTVEAMPYFFGTQNKEGSDMIYTWKVNNQTVENNTAAQGSITLRQTGESGLASVSLNARHRNNQLESVATGLSFKFGKNSSSKLFPAK